MIHVLEEKKAKAIEIKDGDAPMAAPGADEQVIRGASRNAPLVAFQMVCVLYFFIISIVGPYLLSLCVYGIFSILYFISITFVVKNG